MNKKNVSTINPPTKLKLGGGAQFWGYTSPQNNTEEMIKNWEIKISQGSWSDSITSKNPTKEIQTPGLSGLFDVVVKVLSGSTGLWQEIPPLEGSTNQIGCNDNCAAMVGIVADSMNPPLGSINAKFWTVWDAFCD